MERKHQLTPSQNAYAMAKACHTVCKNRHDAYNLLIDAEAERLGIPGPYAILPEGHPMWVEAQRLLDLETAANKLLYAAAHNLFDWATEATLAKCGTPGQHAGIRRMVATVKEMAYVEQPFEELVDMSMRLRAA
jgi:hypothetical protein